MAQEWKQALLPLLPPRLRGPVDGLCGHRERTVEELRLRVDMPVQALGRDWEAFFDQNGPTGEPRGALRLEREECSKLLGAIAQNSLYAFEEELRRGFVTLQGGYRVGLCGKTLVENGRLLRLGECTFFNFRVTREILNCARPVLPHVTKGGRALSALFISPPGCGKTTMLRDVARLLSLGEGAEPHKVCIADERSELAGCAMGAPQRDVGPRTDVLDGCPKAQAIELLIRAMSPQVIVTDEIGMEEDYAALLHSSNAGVALVASAHGTDIECVREKPLLRQLWQAGVFDRYVVLDRSRGPGTVRGVYDRALEGVRAQ